MPEIIINIPIIIIIIQIHLQNHVTSRQKGTMLMYSHFDIHKIHDAIALPHQKL